MMYEDNAYINKIFESWKPLAFDCSSDSRVIVDTMIQCTVEASNKLKFEFEDADIIAARKTYTLDKIVNVNDSFIFIDFINLIKI